MWTTVDLGTVARAIAHAPPPSSPLRRRVRSWLRPGSGTRGEAVEARRGRLFAYTAASIVAGLSLLAWTTVTLQIRPAIDPQLRGTAVDGPAGGLLLWIYGPHVTSMAKNWWIDPNQIDPTRSRPRGGATIFV